MPCVSGITLYSLHVTDVTVHLLQSLTLFTPSPFNAAVIGGIIGAVTDSAGAGRVYLVQSGGTHGVSRRTAPFEMFYVTSI